MLIFVSTGRLGNQIFQYLFLKTISKRNERILCFNMRMFFESFNFDQHSVYHISNKYISYLFRKVIVRLLLNPLSRARLINYVKQSRDSHSRPLPHWEERKGALSCIRYVDTDFYQSEAFFDENQISTSNLRVKEEFLVEARQFLSNIPENCTTVFIHVRRGDYINESFMGKKGIDLPKSYYAGAIDLIKERVKDPYFIFLSDDPSYVANCFQEIEPKLISKNSMQVDLAIMTLCKVGVISNSSFSWWGAYLMSERSLVVAPKYWYGWKQQVESHPGIQPSFSIVLDIKSL